jgi:cytochrome P450
MRLYPAVVLNARVTNKHSILPTGGGSDGSLPVLVRKGDIVVFSTWARHRLGKEFGNNPGKFYPERWENLSPEMPGFIPFNKGPRTCPGRKSLSSSLLLLICVLS